MVSLPGGTSTQAGTAAVSGAPSTVLFNGLAARADASAHFPLHGAWGAAGTMPSALAAESFPYLTSIKVLVRRGTAILYFNSVAGAADYRAYAVPSTGFIGGSGVNFISTPNGMQPRGALISCAGFRTHSYESPIIGGQHTRELQQAVELPGFTVNGNYTIVLEALNAPCPFTGMPADTDATITAHFPSDPSTYKNTNFHVAMTSFATMMSSYGNEILGGMGSYSNWVQRLSEPMGYAVTPASSSSLAQPGDIGVIARSAVAVQVPGVDEASDAPTIDVSNAVTDDFLNDLVVAPSSITTNPDYGPNPLLAPLATIPGAWQFWGRYMQYADGEGTVTQGGATVYQPNGFKGFQVFQQHGRLYTLFGDAGQDVGGTMSFASLKNLPLQLDDTKYVHSMWRVNSDASHRRYWTWAICGGATQAELVNTTTHVPVIRPIITETTFGPGGDNPTAKLGPLQASGAPKECLSIIQEGRPEAPRSDGNERSSGRITAQIHPAGVATGIIALGNTFTDSPAPNGATSLGFRYKTDASGNYLGPLIEPFDQAQPLTHYDVFLRRDRLVVFINGRQGFCVDLSAHPLTMSYGLVTYGDLLYHSALEWQEVSNVNAALYHHQLNAPSATSRVWDAIYESDGFTDIPPEFATFNPAACFAPATLAVQ